MENENQNHAGNHGSGSGGQDNNTLAISIVVAAVLISGSILYAVNRPARVGADVPAPTGANKPAVSLAELTKLDERDIVMGNKNAPVTMIEFGDYQCPFCARYFSQTEPLVRKNYVETGKVKVVYRDIAFLGPESKAAAESAECAKDQNKFWEYHDALYTAEAKDGQEHNGNLNRELFVGLAKTVGMDVSAFGKCLDARTHAATVIETGRRANEAGINGTPNFLINGGLLEGAQPYTKFEQVLNSALAGK